MNYDSNRNIAFQILCSVDPKLLRLTSHDDHIYQLFRDTFPNMKIDKIQEDELKSLEAKKKWRPFCEQFKEAVEDYNFGTLIRLDCTEDYSEQNSILTTRIQFYAIELARNKEGLNDGLRKQYKSKKTDKE